MRFNSGIMRAGILALGVVALSTPGFAQTNTDSGTRAPDQNDMSKGVKTAPATTGGKMMQKSGSMPSRSTTGSSTGETDAKGAPIQRDQLGAKPGGLNSAPANPCTSAQKSQDRC